MMYIIEYEGWKPGRQILDEEKEFGSDEDVIEYAITNNAVYVWEANPHFPPRHVWRNSKSTEKCL